MLLKGFECRWLHGGISRNFIVNKTNAQWEISRNLSNDFRVYKIPDSNKNSSNGNGDNDSVHNPKHRFFEHFFAVIKHRNQDGDSGPVACKSLKSGKLKFGYGADG